MTDAGLAPRIKSGAARSMSPWTAFLFGIHCISLSSSGIIAFSWVASVWPGASIIGVLSIAVGLCFVHAAAYAIIGNVVPEEGADYVFASRVVSPRLAFSVSFTLVVFSGIVAGGLAAWVPTTALPSLLRPMAIIFQNHAFADFADYISSPLGMITLGTVIIVIAAITTVRASAVLKALLNAGLVFGLIAWCIILWSLASAHHPSEFVTAWDRFMGSTSPYGAFDKRIPLAISSGMVISHSASQMTWAGLIMGFWIYYGYYIPTFFAEEVKRPRRSLFIAAWASLLVAFLIFGAAALLLQRLVSPDWIAAEGYLFNNQAAVTKAAGGTSVVAMPWITFYAAILEPWPILILIVCFGWLFTLVNLVQTYFFYTSRIIVSWTQDRVIPSWFLGRDQVPSFNRAVFATALLAFGGLVDAAIGGPLATQLTFVFFVVVTQLVPVFALAALPRLNPGLFNSLPQLLKARYFGLPISTWVAVATLLYLLWMTAAAFIFPAAGVANPIYTVSILGLFIAGGFAVFSAMRSLRQRKEGIDILRTYTSLGERAPDVEFEAAARELN